MVISKHEIWPIIRLAAPVLLARAGAILIITVDVAMCGYAGTKEIAFYGLANGLHVSLILIGIGSVLPVAILTASYEGNGKFANCGAIWRVGLVHALALGISLGILMLYGEYFFRLVGQSEELSVGAGRVLAMHGLGLAGLLCFITTSLLLEGLQRPIPAMVVTLGSNILNLYLNWMFIFGNHGAPAMGAEGAALATSIVRWAGFLILLVYVFYAVDRIRYGIVGKLRQFREFSKNLRQLGYPTALGHGMESASFLVMTLFAGYMGVLETAAWTIGMNLITIAFMIGLGYSMAASVRVANFLGQRSPQKAALSGWTALILGAISLSLIAALFFAAPEFLSRLYSQDPEVLTIAVPMVIAAAFILVLDGLQAVCVGVLRGYQDMWFITRTLITAFWVVMIPSAWLFGIHMGAGPTGLMWSVGVACLVAIFMMVYRFRRLIVKSLQAHGLAPT